MSGRGRRGGNQVDELLVVDLAGGKHLSRLPDDGARAGALAAKPTVEHRPTGQHDGWNVDRGSGHQLGRRGLVAAGGEHHAVDWIAEQDLDQSEVGKVAVERGGRPFAGLLDRMHWELESNAASLADAFAHAMGQN